MLKDINKSIIVTSIVLVSVIVLVGKLSYSAFTLAAESDSSTLQFGDINITLCYTSDCTNNGTMLGNVIGTRTENGVTSYIPQYPISDASYSTVTPYKFTVTNTGSLDLYLSLYLEPDTSVNTSFSSTESVTLPNTGYITGNGGSGTNSNITQTFTGFVSPTQYKYFKVALLEENTDNAYTKAFNQVVSDDNRIVGNISLESGQTRTYLLYVWLSKDVLTSIGSTENTNEVMGRYLITNIYAKGEYRPDTN